MSDFKELFEKYPFISFVTYGNTEYIGIIQNVDDLVTTIYDYGSLKSNEEKTEFLNLGETWWWESNRMIPINLFLRDDWAKFKYTHKSLMSKDVEIKFGHYVSLKEMACRKGKRRSIILIRRVT